MWGLAACAPAGETDVEPAPAREPCIVVTPGKINFGELAAGESAAFAVTIENRCQEDPGDGSLTDPLEIRRVSLDDPTAPFTFTEPLTLLLAAVSTTEVTVTATATTAGTVKHKLFIDSNDPDEPRTDVKLVFDGLAPIADADVTSLDLGSVWIGCEAATAFTIRNPGNQTLILEDPAVPAPFSLRGPAGPVAVEPGASAEWEVAFTPVAAGEQTATGSIATNDPVTPRLDVSLRGLGVDAGLRRDETFARPAVKVDVLFVVDASATLDDELDDLRDHVAPFVAALAGTDAHVAVMTSADLDFLGEEGIDEVLELDFDLAATLRSRLRLTAPDRGNGVTDMAWGVCESGRDGDPTGDFHRADARLSVVAISDREDLSSVYASEDVVDDFIALKGGDPALFRYHAIVGEVPTPTCDVDPGDGFDDATALSGGALLSICGDPDTTFAALGAAVVPTSVTLTLAGDAIPATIAVDVDGVPAATWAYDPATRALTLPTPPDDGAKVRVRYDERPICP